MSNTVTPSFSAFNSIVDEAAAAIPVVEEVAITVADARSGNEAGAVTEGIKAAEGIAGLTPGLASTAQGIAGDVSAIKVFSTSETATKIADVTAHVVSGGMLAMIEHDLGGMLPDAVRARVQKMMSGFIHAATLFHFL